MKVKFLKHTSYEFKFWIFFCAKKYVMNANRWDNLNDLNKYYVQHINNRARKRNKC